MLNRIENGAPYQVRSESELKEKKSDKDSDVHAKFSDVYKNIQSQYSEKDKPREIKKTLGKDDFLKIMVTQMKNQDPTNAFKAEQMAAQLAQFTSVEQLQNIDQNISKVLGKNKPIENMAMTHLIGKKVTIDKDKFNHTEGKSDQLNFNIPSDVYSLQIDVKNDSGEIVFSKDFGPTKQGSFDFNWDGVRSDLKVASSGNYSIQMDGKDQSGKKIDISARKTAQVMGVSFEGVDPVFLVGDAKHQDKITMKNIIKIEMGQESEENKVQSQVIPKKNIIG
jgi:flagellar basal-body rod modification protein FlgD